MSEKSKKLKLIWEFRGPEALHIAKHHEIHLKEFIQKHQLSYNITGYEQLSEVHSIAFMVVDQDEKITVRDALKPQRGQYYQE